MAEDDPKIINNYKQVTANWRGDKSKTFKVFNKSNEVKGTITINKNILSTSDSNVEIGGLTTPPDSEYRYILHLVAPPQTQKVFMVNQFSLNNEFIMTEPVFLQEESIFESMRSSIGSMKSSIGSMKSSTGSSMGSVVTKSGDKLDITSNKPIPKDSMFYEPPTPPEKTSFIPDVKGFYNAIPNVTGRIGSITPLFTRKTPQEPTDFAKSFVPGESANLLEKPNVSRKWGFGGKTRRRGKTQKRKRSKKSRKTKSKK